MTPIAPWLKRHLEETGRWNADSVSRKAKVRRHHCGQIVVVGLDGDMCATAVIADTTPLTPLGEALAHIGGRNTYNLTWWAHPRLDRRHAIEIVARPAGSRDGTDTVAAHVCHQHFDGAAVTTSNVRPRATTLTTDAEPPF